MDEPIALTPETARDAAADAVQSARDSLGVELDYSPDSLAAVDRILHGVHLAGRKSRDLPGAVLIFGCYVGEVLIRDLGGAWLRPEEAGFQGATGHPIVLALPDATDGTHLVCNPLGKVGKRIDNGPEDSLPSFYQALRSKTRPGAGADADSTPPDREPTVPDWPTRPDARGRVPSLLEILGSPGTAAAQAMYLVAATATLKSRGWEPAEYQVVARCPEGHFTIPCVARRGEEYLLIFSHAGPWSEDDCDRFGRWSRQVRTCEQVKGVPIRIVHDEEPVALREKGMTGERFGVWTENVAWSKA
jgi:hypothetical protein